MASRAATRTPDVTAVRPWVITEFRKHTASVFGGLFGGAAFDQVALPAVAAAVDRTGRFAENFSDRGVRSGFSALLALWGDPADRAAEAESLKQRHRDVHGRGSGDFEGVRYSALDPENWIWIGVSGILVALNSFTFCTGITMRPAEREAAYQVMREAFVGIELPGRSGKLPATFADATTYYDRMVETKLEPNPFLIEQFAGLTKLPLPTLLLPNGMRILSAPLWFALRPAVGHVVQVCSSKAMHPGVQRLTGFRLERRHELEFRVYSRAMQLGWRVLPDRVLLAPLAYNRLQYEKLARFHRRYALESFAPPRSGRSDCPV
ncbi:DUF2236 domain-containing protein [Aldersonia sp. NBC_00410]|uniref:oxygenase MpaB family protein n=1 Tax=Aldersonia sp. NBC_00410 TaxID=2975954 RepID=UPI002250F3EE|nr:oxygenase MpaB family protein [Aldersonia sp. NBC_00410]MCX5044895.1 DUF2236 domain-containing protein [Aldersonia sp. NBC_00410]